MNESGAIDDTLSPIVDPLKCFYDAKAKLQSELINVSEKLKSTPVESIDINSHQRDLWCLFDELSLYYEGLMGLGLADYSESCEFEFFKKWWKSVIDDLNAAARKCPISIPTVTTQSPPSYCAVTCTSHSHTHDVSSMVISENSNALVDMRIGDTVCDSKSSCDNQCDINVIDPRPSQTTRRSKYARPEAPCVLCPAKECHRLWHCPMFKSLKPSERLDVVNSHALCHNCFVGSHKTEICGKKSRCSVPGCGAKHSMYIHIDGVDYNPSSAHKDTSQFCDYFDKFPVSDSVTDPFSQIVMPGKIVSNTGSVLLDSPSPNEVVDKNACSSIASTRAQCEAVSDIPRKLLQVLEETCKSLVSECQLSATKLIETQKVMLSNELKCMADMMRCFDEKLNRLLLEFDNKSVFMQSQSFNDAVLFNPVVASSFCSDSAFDITMSDTHVSGRNGKCDTKVT